MAVAAVGRYQDRCSPDTMVCRGYSVLPPKAVLLADKDRGYPAAFAQARQKNITVFANPQSSRCPTSNLHIAAIANRPQNFGIVEIGKSETHSRSPASSRGTLRPIVTKREAGSGGGGSAQGRSARDASDEAVQS